MNHIVSVPGLEALTIGTIFCIGRNYARHADEMKQAVPEEPMIFIKPLNTITSDGSSILLPPQSREVHHEVELVAAIGKGGKNISQDQALNHVAGYGIGIDVTARDIQQKAKQKSHPWTVSKGFDTFAPLSSFIAADSVKDPQDLHLKLKVNNRTRQDGYTRDMIFPVHTLVAYISTIFTLSPGDLIFTGTPEGVSPIRHGDVVEASLNDSAITLKLTV